MCPRKRCRSGLTIKSRLAFPATVLYLHTAPNVFGRATNKRRPSLCQKSEEMIPAGCGSGKKYKDCHLSLEEKLAQYRRNGVKTPVRSMLKTKEQIEGIRQSANINVAVLDYVAEHIGPGVTTEQIDQWVYEQTTHLGGIPAPLGYNGFPRSVCTSLNDQVCHGIPSADDVLKEGDIINVDVSTIYKG